MFASLEVYHITAAMTKQKVVWNDENIGIGSKIRLMRSLAMSIFLYACELWTITADIERIQALEMRCFRELLGISYRDHITNEEVKARNRNAIGPYEDLLTAVKRRKLKQYGHVTRLSGLAKTVLQGTAQGGRWRGRQRKQWDDNIKEWTGLEWNIILRKAENREEWRKLVVKSTVVPHRSARLRDRKDKIRKKHIIKIHSDVGSMDCYCLIPCCFRQVYVLFWLRLILVSMMMNRLTGIASFGDGQVDEMSRQIGMPLAMVKLHGEYCHCHFSLWC